MLVMIPHLRGTLCIEVYFKNVICASHLIRFHFSNITAVHTSAINFHNQRSQK